MKIERVVFMGTPEFALPSLAALRNFGFSVVGAFTQPDRPSGRGNRLIAPPVKLACVEAGIPVFQFERVKSPEGVAALRALAPDVLVTAAFGQLLSQEILDIPPGGCVNVHASLLPQYRGAAPVQWAVIHQRKKTGVTTMLTDIGMDTGAILMKQELTLAPDETAGSLMARLAELGAPLLVETLLGLRDGTIHPQPQDDSQATSARPLRKRHEALRWELSADRVVGWIRGLSPQPGAYGILQGQRYKFYQARVFESKTGQPGELLIADAQKGLLVATGDGAVEILEMQAPGGKRMAAKAYLAGKTLRVGTCFDIVPHTAKELKT